MKHLFLSIFILTIAAGESSAQWKDFRFDSPAAFGVHNDTLFASHTNGKVYRYAPETPDKWIEADTGMMLGNGLSITAFGSIGSYFLAAANSQLGGGAYRSGNDGSLWIPTHAPQTNCFLTIRDTIYSGGAGGVYYSTDSGMNWTQFTNSQRGVNALAVLGTTLFEGTNAGLYFSTNNGQNWTQTSVTAAVSSIAVADSVIVAALYNGGIYRSKDGGSAWKHDATGLLNGYVNSLVSDGKNLFAGTGASTVNGTIVEGSGVFLSTDSGASWDTVNTGFPEGLDGSLNISTVFIFDTIVIAGTWDNAGQVARSYARPILEMVPKEAVAESPQPAGVTISAFPNPLSNSTIIAYLLPESISVNIEIFDALGRSIESLLPAQTENAGPHQVEFHANKLPSGIYWCKFTAGDATQFLTLSIER